MFVIFLNCLFSFGVAFFDGLDVTFTPAPPCPRLRVLLPGCWLLALCSLRTAAAHFAASRTAGCLLLPYCALLLCCAGGCTLLWWSLPAVPPPWP